LLIVVLVRLAGWEEELALSVWQHSKVHKELNLGKDAQHLISK
jgi:hypothetical protein